MSLIVTVSHSNDHCQSFTGTCLHSHSYLSTFTIAQLWNGCKWEHSRVEYADLFCIFSLGSVWFISWPAVSWPRTSHAKDGGDLGSHTEVPATLRVKNYAFSFVQRSNVRCWVCMSSWSNLIGYVLHSHSLGKTDMNNDTTVSRQHANWANTRVTGFGRVVSRQQALCWHR